MKASLKLREEKSPLVRAKIPLNVLGLPLFTGLTSGDQQELALHLGTYFQAGPSFRLSYKPNDGQAPFSVLAKTGIGLWGSPSGAALALSAEVNLQSDRLPSFSFRVKPRFGDFGFKKQTRSFMASYLNPDRMNDEMLVCGTEDHSRTGESIEGKSKTSRLSESYLEVKSPVLSSLPGSVANGDHHAKDSGDLGTESGGARNVSLDRSFRGEEKLKEMMVHHKNGFQSSLHDDSYASGYDDADSDVDDSAAATVGEQGVPWVGSSSKGWSMSTHSRLPLGRWAEVKARWHVKFGSNLFNDLRHGLRITDVKLPSLSIDKVSFQTLDRSTNIGSSGDVLGEGFGYHYLRGGEDSQLARILDLCASMRYQLHLLHLENNVLKNTLGDLRGDVGTRRPALKGSELMIQEENALRSQMFDELNSKSVSGSRSREGNCNKGRFLKGDSQDVSRSDVEKLANSSEFSINSDPSEELKKAIMNAGG